MRKVLKRFAIAALALGDDGVLKRRRKASSFRDLEMDWTLLSTLADQSSVPVSTVSSPSMWRLCWTKQTNATEEILRVIVR